MIDLPVGRSRPGDARGFFHKELLGFGAKVAGIGAAIGIPGAGTVSRIAGALAGTARITPTSKLEKKQGSAAKGFRTLGPFRGDGGPCDDPRLVRAPDGHCVSPGSGHARSHGVGDVPGVGVPVGDAVMGRYGAALTPGSLIIDRAVCLRGMQLGDDGLCYNKSQISNKQRMWPAGRKPLLSGGDMRAISIAARAGRRLEGATKRLQRLGMMKKPSPRRGPTQHQRLLEAHVTK